MGSILVGGPLWPRPQDAAPDECPPGDVLLDRLILHATGIVHGVLDNGLLGRVVLGVFLHFARHTNVA